MKGLLTEAEKARIVAVRSQELSSREGKKKRDAKKEKEYKVHKKHPSKKKQTRPSRKKRRADNN